MDIRMFIAELCIIFNKTGNTCPIIGKRVDVSWYSHGAIKNDAVEEYSLAWENVHGILIGKNKA